MKKLKERNDLTQGNLMKNMVMLFLPLLLTNLLNSIYNFVDGIWIGNIVGEGGISVSTNVYPILFLTTAVGYALATATSVLISQYYGAKDNKNIKKVVKMSVISTAIIIITFNLIMGIASNLWLKILNTPQEVWNETRSYYLIYLVAYFFNYILMNIMESLRAIGDSRTPIIFVSITTILNIVLDPILLKTPLGISGAAIATLIAIVVGLVVAIIYVNIKSELLRWNFKQTKFDKEIFIKFLKVSIPIILQEWFIGIVLLFEVKVSNETGVEGSASYGVVGKLEQIVWIIGTAFKTMVTVAVGQFVGNKKFDETKDIVSNGLKLAIVPMVIVAILVYVFPYQVCRIFLKNETIISSAIRFLRIMGIPFICVPFRSMARGFIGGTGHTKTLLISSITAGCVELSLMFMLKRFGMDNLVMLGCAIIGYMLVETSINVAYYFSNKWKKSII